MATLLAKPPRDMRTRADRLGAAKGVELALSGEPCGAVDRRAARPDKSRNSSAMRRAGSE